MPLWPKGRCSLLKSNLKGHALPDTGEHAAASSWPLFVALELNVILPGKASQRRHIRTCAFGHDDFTASSGTAV